MHEIQYRHKLLEILKRIAIAMEKIEQKLNSNVENGNPRRKIIEEGNKQVPEKGEQEGELPELPEPEGNPWK